MEHAKLGSSDVRVSRVIFGAWAVGGWRWGGADDDQSVAAIRRALELGIDTIDTAPMYGCGHSECVVGRAIEGRRDEVVIATKCGLRWDRDDGTYFYEGERTDGTTVKVYKNLKRDAILEEIDRSLERLGVDYVDLYQCHWPDASTPLEETAEALNQVLEQGKARAVGVSNFTPAMIEEIRQYVPIASDQPLYNMLDRQAEAELLPYCADGNVAVICYSPLHQGLLTGKVPMDRTFGHDDIRIGKPWFGRANRRRVLAFLERVRPIAEVRGKTLAQVAVNWALCRRGMTAALVGARRPEQVEENVGGADWRLTEEELAAIRGWLEELGEPE
jgi:aryl-alcohol dehydrogenase-like predicted oxidoreductase